MHACRLAQRAESSAVTLSSTSRVSTAVHAVSRPDVQTQALNNPVGPEARENFSTLVPGRATTGTWGRLAPHIDTTPKGNTHPGRVHVVRGLTAHPTQVSRKRGRCNGPVVGAVAWFVVRSRWAVICFSTV